MNMNFRKRSLSFFLCLMLIVAMAFTTTGCNDKAEDAARSTTEGTVQAEADAVEEAARTEAADGEKTAASSDAGTQEEPAKTAAEEVQILGEGKTIFSLSVVDGEGKETLFEIHTDKTTVGEALLELELVAGEVQQYGLYIKSVNGITADFDVDKTYWAFYINDEYAQTGIDQTKIEEGTSYSLRVEK